MEDLQLYEIIEQKFKEFIRYYPQEQTDEVMRNLAEGLEIEELTDREIILVRACEEHFQDRIQKFTNTFLGQFVDLSPFRSSPITVKDVVKAKEIQVHWDKLNAAVEADPTTKKQWDNLMLTLKLGQIN